jgi:ribosomal protein S18 acetylase RimI-like enzyme
MQDAAAAFTLLVDANSDSAVSFYERYGFRSIAEKPRTLFLPLLDRAEDPPSKVSDLGGIQNPP